MNIPEGMWYQSDDRLDELNVRLSSRTMADHHNKPNFDMRSVPTRCVNVFPIVDARKRAKVAIKRTQTPEFDQGSVAGMLSNIDTESALRNQYYALQHGAPQGMYIPSSQSDLYRVSVPTTSHPVVQTHPGLFERHTYRTTGNSIIERMNVGKDLFFNATQTQLGGTSSPLAP